MDRPTFSASGPSCLDRLKFHGRTSYRHDRWNASRLQVPYQSITHIDGGTRYCYSAWHTLHRHQLAASERPIAPYAPAANVVTVIHRLRQRGIPLPVTRESLTILGIPDGNAPRTLQALKLLGIVEEDGQISPSAERLRRASEDEYPEALAQILREAYAPIFEVTDPATDTELRISDAFRQYDPTTQRGRMVTLFMALCAEAGITSGPRQRPNPRPRSSAPQPRRRQTEPQTMQPANDRASSASGLVMAITDADIDVLTDEEFKDVWDALGKLARARARRPGTQSQGDQGEE